MSIRIDVWSDVVCPWCYIGKRRLETALGLAIRELVQPGVLTLPQMIYRMSTRPAQVFNLVGGTLGVGAPADVVVFDPAMKWKVDAGHFCSKSRNTPFGGEELVGRALMTLVDGRIVFQR